MNKFMPGKVLKQIRIERNLKSKQVYDGVCNATTYSRIENGSQTPSMYTFAILMERLGVDYRKFYIDIQCIEDYKEYMKKEEIIRLIREYDYERADICLREFTSQYGFSEEEIKMETVMDSVDLGIRLRTQFILTARAALKTYDKKLALQMLLYAISITVNNFDDENICSYLLSLGEIEIINSISIIYAEMGNIEKAISILFQVKRNMDMYYTDESEKSMFYPVILYNLTKLLGSTKRYTEAIELCDSAIGYCCLYNNMRPLPLIIYNKAYCLFYLSDKINSLALSKEAYYCARAQCNFRAANHIREKTIERLFIDVDDRS